MSPEIISRKDALAHGLRRYFTGRPCKRGHVAQRNRSGNCLTCRSIWRATADEGAAEARRRRTTPHSYLSAKYSVMQSRIGGASKPHLYRGLGIMSRREFLAWGLDDPAFNKLWWEWQKSGRPMKLAPSIDRIDTQRGYVLGNVQFITHSENSGKASNWRWHGINPITKAA